MGATAHQHPAGAHKAPDKQDITFVLTALPLDGDKLG